MAQQLSFNHYLAENIHCCCQELIPYLATKLSQEINFDVTMPLASRLQGLITGDLSFAWLCGLLYTRLKDAKVPLETLVAPVIGRQEQPLYSSYLVVHRDSPYQHMTDLKDLGFAINEDNSFSGHHLARHHMADFEQRFTRIRTGSHHASLQAVAQGKADLASIDNTLYDYWLRKKPKLVHSTRILRVFDSFPMPPLVVHGSLSTTLKSSLLTVLTTMNEDPQGHDILQRHQISHFVPMSDHDYQPIREVTS